MSASGKLSLDNRVFVPVENSENGVASGKTRFHFWQDGMIFYADYFGGDVREGHIIGTFDEDGTGDLLYHCLTTDKQLKAGKAKAVFSKTQDERLAFELDWEWISLDDKGDDHSWGQSRYEEVLDHEIARL